MMSWSTAQVEAGPGVWHKFAHRCLQGSRLDVHCNLRLLACLVPAAAHATVALVLPGIDCSCLSWRPRRAGRQGAVWRRQLLSRARARAARAGALGEPGCWAWPGRPRRWAGMGFGWVDSYLAFMAAGGGCCLLAVHPVAGILHFSSYPCLTQPGPRPPALPPQVRHYTNSENAPGEESTYIIPNSGAWVVAVATAA